MRSPPGWPGRRPAVLAALAGVLAATGQAPLGLWPVALAGFALMIRLVAAAPTRGTAAWLGWIAGAAQFAAAMPWIVEPFLIDPARHAWLIPFALVALNGGLALFWAAAAALSTLARRRALGFAAALAAAEMLRGHVLTGFPWALPGHVWLDSPVAQLAALFGGYGLTLATLLVAAGLSTLRPLPALAGVAAVAAGFGFGLWRLSLPEPPPPGPVIRLVQPNADQGLKWDADSAQLFFNRLLDNTAAPPPAGQPRPALVIWPETALPYLMEPDSMLPVLIADAGQGSPVMIGYQRSEESRAWNSLAVIGPDAMISASYDKHHLVPFGEYIPFGDLAYDWFGLTAFAARLGAGYSAGPPGQILDLGPTLGRVLPLICYEAVFPHDLRRPGPRADWIVQATNDAWFGTRTGPWQHLAQARLRAIEQGLPLARAANTGVTAMIDARGRITAELPFGTEGHLDAALPAALAAPPYARFGEWPVLLWLAGVGALAFRRRRPVLA